MDAISRRYRKPKGRPSKRRSLCASKVQKRWGKNHMQSDFDSTVCAKNSDILLAENSIIMHTENSISVEGSDAGENEQYLNASARKFQMFPSTSTSTFCPSEKSTYVLMNNDMWSSLLYNIKCDECDMCSLDVKCNGAYGFSSKIELKCKSCKKIFNSVFSSPRDDDSKCFEANKKLVEAFLKIGKGHAALELFSMAIGIHAMDKKTFSKCLLKLYEEKCSFKEDILEISRKVVRKHHEDLLGIVNAKNWRPTPKTLLTFPNSPFLLKPTDIPFVGSMMSFLYSTSLLIHCFFKFHLKHGIPMSESNFLEKRHVASCSPIL
ncbi:uncharacterized protein TNIN_90521 [Trichonephila inaurata madagascariensis]|uniref:Mutator-like transposase domain-containing protein n=1 Tax=Trichonephila inaurata madagascariensis TaxID=2747483 RepID=A0A8X6WS35_9ARAC|nr:uncharacterized protein TNIN_90521 [Trichonephila inaurata madagascariensis]